MRGKSDRIKGKVKESISLCVWEENVCMRWEYVSIYISMRIMCEVIWEN